MNNGLLSGLERRSPLPARAGPGWPPDPAQRDIGVSWYPAPGGLMIWGGEENAGTTLTDGRECAFWRLFPTPIAISALGTEVTSVAVGSVIRFGIRLVDWANMVPGRLVVDAGTINSASGGAMEVALAGPVTLWGYYFVTITAQGGAPAVRAAAAAGQSWGNFVGAYNASFPSSGWNNWGWYQSTISADLPFEPQNGWNGAPFGSGGGSPAIFMRRAPK